MKTIMLGAACALAAGAALGGALRPAPIFGDHMVLQQGTNIAVFGTAAPGADVSLSFRGKTLAAKADDAGRWRAVLGPLEAGGPDDLTLASAGETLVIRDVLVGEVWMCCGQSNMAGNLEKEMHAADEIPRSANSALRYFWPECRGGAQPKETIGGRWFIAGPESVPNWSAVAYYFGRDIQKALSKPVGLLMGAQGATSAQNWMSDEALRANPEFTAVVSSNLNADGLSDDWAAARRKLTDWEENVRYKDQPNAGLTNGWAGAGFDDGAWKSVELPRLWKPGGKTMKGDFDMDAAAVWFRKRVEIPENWSGRELALSLGRIKQSDIVYLNGFEIGRTADEWTPRAYRIGAALFKPGAATIAVRVLNLHGYGGFDGAAADMRLAPAEGKDAIAAAMSLAGAWKFQLEYRVPWWSMNPPVRHSYLPSIWYNGVTAPLSKYPVRGVIWWQGEYGGARYYRALFPVLIRDWRRTWNNEQMPFLFVQLARVGKPAGGAVQESSDYAGVREAQRLALALPNTAMAVSFDVTDGSLHPANKRGAGERLALAALATVYGRSIPYSGPLPVSAALEDGAAVVTFKHAEGLAAAGGKPLAEFALAGTDGVFKAATAEIREGRVAARSDAVARPVKIRYAWFDYPQGNLFNGAGLPASPFELDVK